VAFYDTTFYCNAGDQSTTGHYAVTKWAASASIAAGALRRQLAAPSVNNERVFICIVAGTTGGSEPSWVLTRGAKTTDNTVTWQEVTGASAVNGDLTNTPSWTGVTGGIATAITLGVIIKRNNAASYWICTTAGNTGTTEPAWANNTAGTTQADSTVTWTCLGVVGNFTGGQAPHARLVNVFGTSWFTAGNTIYLGDNHAETQSAPNLGLTATGSQTIMSKVLCHNHSGSYPPTAGNLTTGATISTTAFATITLSLITGSFYFYGIAFKAGSGTSGSTAYFVINNSGAWAYFDNCSFQIIATGSGNTITFGSNSSSNLGNVIFNNTTVYFGNVGDSMNFLLHQFLWQNTGQVLAAGSSVPTNFLYASTGSGGQQDTIVLEALDLSQITGNLFNVATTTLINVTIKDCKLNAAATIPALTTNSGPIVQLVRSDSGATGYKSSRYTFEGAETTDTTVTRVGGAADPTGQAQSRKIVTTANSQWLRPFKAEPYAIWNPRTAANVVVTVCGNAVGALPNNDDIWLEVEYLGSSASPLGTIVTTTKSNVLAANAAVPSDASSWNYTIPNTTLNPADKEAHISLSGGNLTALGTAGWTGSVRVVDGQSTGKYYWECTFNASAAGSGVGANISALAIATIFSGAGTGQAGVVQNGSVYVDGSTTITVGGVGSQTISFGTITSGTVICVAIDVPNKLIWWRLGAAGNWNNNASRNPATGAGGVSIPNISTAYPSLSFGGADTIIANFGSSAFTGAVPSGFTAGFPAAFTLTPFKLTTTLSAPQPGLAGYLHARVRAAKPSSTFYIDPQITLS
jgi:hypothetical protein